MKKLKHLFLKWLLKEQYLGFSIQNNSLSNCKLDYNTISLTTYGNIIVNGIELGP
jgi:hypothetical protein